MKGMKGTGEKRCSRQEERCETCRETGRQREREENTERDQLSAGLYHRPVEGSE